jgi:protein-tyrosine-phosphatase
MVKTKILFVCRYNRFRSRVAEAYFNKTNKNKNFEVRSAGLFQGSFPIAKNEIKVAKKFGLNISGRPKAISADLLNWQNKIIIVANNIPRAIFKSRKWKRDVVVWKIKDVDENFTEERLEKIIKKICRKIDKLIKSIEVDN